MRVVAHAEGAAGRVVGGDEQQPAVGARAAGAGARLVPGLARSRSRLGGRGSRSGRGRRRRRAASVHGGHRAAVPASARLDLGGRRHGGRALEPGGDDRAGDVGEPDGALAGPSRRAGRGTSAPPKASPAPRPLTTSTGNGGTSTRSSRVAASTPRGPCLTTASSSPRSSRASAARCGSVSPTATSHSSRLPTATVTCSRARPTWSWPPPGRPRTSAGSRGRARCAARGRGPPRRRSARRGSAPATGPVTVAQKTRASRIASSGRSSGLDQQVGRRRVAVEVQREVVRREDLAERDRRRRPVAPRTDEAGRRRRGRCGLRLDVAAERRRRPVRVIRRGACGRAGPRRRRRSWRCRRGTSRRCCTSSSPTPCCERVDVDAGPPDRDDVVGRVAGAHGRSPALG